MKNNTLIAKRYADNNKRNIVNAQMNSQMNSLRNHRESDQEKVSGYMQHDSSAVENIKNISAKIASYLKLSLDLFEKGKLVGNHTRPI